MNSPVLFTITLILYSYLRLVIFSGLPTKLLYVFSISLMLANFPANFMCLHMIALKYLVVLTGDVKLSLCLIKLQWYKNCGSGSIAL
jgi:hypothetical protein